MNNKCNFLKKITNHKNFGHTKDGKECLVYRSTVDPAVGYEFSRRLRNGVVRRTAGGEAYICSGCVAAQKRMRNEGAENRPTVRQIIFGANGEFTTDPEQHFQSRIIAEKLAFGVRLNVEEIPMDDLKKYAERQAYNTTPDFDDEAVNQAIAMPLPVIPPIRPRLQQIPPIRPQLQQIPPMNPLLQNQNQHLINPNLLQNPFNEAQQQQIFMNPQMQMLLLQQQQQQQQAYQQQMTYFQWQQMMAQNRFRFP